MSLNPEERMFQYTVIEEAGRQNKTENGSVAFVAT